ncbi:MAG TPA: MG2 domain-containing protein [Cytophagaceae bacterium]|nr:MG2 domain-containing protein [Cytophagaceae bacterium]
MLIRNLPSLVVTFVITVFLFSCSGNKLKLDDKNFDEEIELQQNLVFNFNKNLVPDSLINIWMDEPYITFTPEVKGKFKWTGNDELVFSPDISFLPSTDYTATFTDKLVAKAEKKYSLPEEAIRFHTPYLNLLGASLFWAKNEQNKNITELRTELVFNAKINPSDLRNLLHVKIGGQEQRFELNSSYNSDKIMIAVPESDGSFDDKNISVVISPGLKCSESNFVSKEEIKYETTIPSKDKFQIIQAEALYEDEKGYINVLTNQQTDEQDIEKLITIEPSLQISVEPHASGFYIRGGFQSGNAYRLVVKKELKGIFGGTLKEEYQQDLVFGAQEPSINFVNKKGIYLTDRGEKNVAVNIINVPEVKLTVYKIYENNIIQFLKKNMYSNYEDYYYEEGYGYGSGYSGIEDCGDLVLEKEIQTKSLKKNGGARLLDLDFKDLNAFQGIYVVTVSSLDQQWIKSSKIISISDIGMIVKETENDIYVFANSIISTDLISGLEVNLISSNNQSVYKAVTDGDGVAKFPDIKKKAPGFTIKMITCQGTGSFNYLYFDETRVETSQFDIGGAYNNVSGYEAFIYGEREIYRPGDTMHLNTVIRDHEWQPLKAVPVKMKVILPNGKEFSAKKGMLNSEGSFATDFILPAATVTGSYNIEVYTANDVLLNSKLISVEEFIPDRIKVNAVLNSETVKLSQPLQVTATALNLFGPPASNRNYEVEMTLSRAYFSPQGFEDYNFQINAIKESYYPNDLRQGKTDENGQATEVFTFPDTYKNSGILDGNTYVTVFDESGRPVHQMKSFEVLTQETFLGIKYFDNYVDINKPLQIPLVAVNKDGKALSSFQARVQVIRYDWQTVMEKNYSGYRYVSQRREVVLEDRNFTISGTKTFYTFNPTRSGSYEVRVKLPETDAYVSQYFYAYGFGTTDNSSFEVDNEGKVTIEMDKDKYEVGEEAKLLFKTPFAGKILVTVERDKVYDYFYLDTDKKSASTSITIKEEYLPNAYISATLIKPNTESSLPLTVGHGYAPLTVERKSNKLELKIEAAEKSRSNTKQRIMVEAANGNSDVEMTIAVVDEGILQLKNTRTPDPYGFFYRRKALEVNAYDIYPKLLPELSGRKSSVAGDGYNLEKRANPLNNRRVKLVSFWSGTLRTNSDGKAYYEIFIPQFSGDLRIMAVAYQGKSFGSASKNMKVADPVVVSTSLPRFLSPGDTALVPVTLTNTTGTNADATAQLNVTGPMMVIGESSKRISIKGNSEQVVQFKIYAKKEIGTGKIVTTVSALNEKFKEETDMTVRPPASLVKQHTSGQVAAGSTEKLTMDNDFIPSSIDGKLIVSRSPMIQFENDLDYLLGYPHGCVEQTVSKAFPQLYFNDMVKSIGAKRKSLEDPNYNVQEAIRKLSAMQLNNGALSYWLGGYDESWWGTVYAAHFLTEARKAGFEVSNSMLEKMYGYLQQKVKEKMTYDYYYYEDGTYRTRQIPAKEIFYSLYILANVGRQDLSIMNYYKSNKNSMALDSRYLLASTYRILGDQGSARALLPTAFEGEKSINAFGGSFYSYTRDMAISLNALVESDPGNPQVGILAQHLTRQMKEQRYLSTQERAFAFIALGKIAKKANESTATAEITADGKSIGSYKGGTLVLTKNISGKEIEISAKGSGALYYFWEQEGLSSDGKVKEEDSFIRVRKAFYDRNGRAISGTNFEQNDLVVVKITVATTDRSSVENVVITDILPAGFEIENPRLSETADMQWIKDNAAPEHFDIRDDRINLFTTVDGNTKSYYYVVRAVSKGSFVMGPVSADAMYNGEYHSYNGAGIIRVK